MEAATLSLPHVARLLPPVVILVFAATLAGMINGDARLKALDAVQLYGFDKASVDAGKAVANNTPAQGDWAWLWDRADTDRCLDMTALNFPTVRFIPGSDPTTPSCQITLATSVTSVGTPQLSITPVFTAAGVVGCVPGKYAMEIGSGKAQPVSASTLTIRVLATAFGNSTLVTVDTPDAASLSTFVSGALDRWATCSRRRTLLAGQYLNHTSCQTDASQMCTCVRAFAGRVANPRTPLQAVLPNGTQLGDALNAGVEKCIRLRRSHDVRSAWGSLPYRRTQALLVIALAVLLNAVHVSFELHRRPGAGLAWLLALIASAALPSIPGAPGTEALLQFAVYGPPLIMGAYAVYLDFVAADDVRRGVAPTAWRPALHPSVFALVLCSLTLFTLVERGVVQAEYLVVEVFKCHAIAAVYAAGAWYRRYLHDRPDSENPFSAATVDQAHVVLGLAALTAAADSVLVPYPTKAPFELHWLLPLAFTYLGLSGASWSRAHAPAGGKHPNLTSLTALLTYLVAGLLVGYFLNEMLITGDRRYADFLDPASGGLPLLAHAE